MSRKNVRLPLRSTGHVDSRSSSDVCRCSPISCRRFAGPIRPEEARRNHAKDRLRVARSVSTLETRLSSPWRRGSGISTCLVAWGSGGTTTRFPRHLNEAPARGQYSLCVTKRMRAVSADGLAVADKRVVVPPLPARCNHRWVSRNSPMNPELPCSANCCQS